MGAVLSTTRDRMTEDRTWGPNAAPFLLDERSRVMRTIVVVIVVVSMLVVAGEARAGAASYTSGLGLFDEMLSDAGSDRQGGFAPAPGIVDSR